MACDQEDTGRVLQGSERHVVQAVLRQEDDGAGRLGRQLILDRLDQDPVQGLQGRIRRCVRLRLRAPRDSAARCAAAARADRVACVGHEFRERLVDAAQLDLPEAAAAVGPDHPAQQRGGTGVEELAEFEQQVGVVFIRHRVGHDRRALLAGDGFHLRQRQRGGRRALHAALGDGGQRPGAAALGHFQGFIRSALGHQRALQPAQHTQLKRIGLDVDLLELGHQPHTCFEVLVGQAQEAFRLLVLAGQEEQHAELLAMPADAHGVELGHLRQGQIDGRARLEDGIRQVPEQEVAAAQPGELPGLLMPKVGGEHLGVRPHEPQRLQAQGQHLLQVLKFPVAQREIAQRVELAIRPMAGACQGEGAIQGLDGRAEVAFAALADASIDQRHETLLGGLRCRRLLCHRRCAPFSQPHEQAQQQPHGNGPSLHGHLPAIDRR